MTRPGTLALVGPQIHSVPAVAQAAPCEIALGAVHPSLRGHVLAYSGFRSSAGLPVAHLLLPVAFPMLVVDFATPYGLVCGARDTATTHGTTTWGYGVAAALTPAGAAALLGVPMGELTRTTVSLADLAGPWGAGLPGRLAAAPTWPARFALLEAVLAARLGRSATGRGPGAAAVPGHAVRQAWRRLQAPDAPRVGPLAAELGVRRRRLERDFRRHIGLTPATVARIARFQRAVDHLARGTGPAAAAAGSGYADQSHLSRDVRALAGCTPGELAGFLDVPPLPGAQSFKTGRSARA